MRNPTNCFFAGCLESGSSSSSPLDVRSMTAAGRFELIDPTLRGATEDEDCSRELAGCPAMDGVPYARGVPILKLSPDFVISIRSSSSSLAKPFVFEACSGFVCNSQTPLGCMVTWSTDFNVVFRISFTYLQQFIKITL